MHLQGCFIGEYMKKRIFLLLLTLVMLFALVPTAAFADADNAPAARITDSDNEMSADSAPNIRSNGRLLRAAPKSAGKTLSCASFISNAENRAYIDRMIVWYLKNEPVLGEALEAGHSVIMFFEGGSDNVDSPRYADISYRDGAVGIIIRNDEEGAAYIVGYCENCNTLPDFPFGYEYDNGHPGYGTAILVDGVYRELTFNHKNTHAALTSRTLSGQAYVPCVYMRDDGSFALLNGTGINVHARMRDTVGDSVNEPTSAGCITVGDEATLSEYNKFITSYIADRFEIEPAVFGEADTYLFTKADEYREAAVMVMDRFLAKEHLKTVYGGNSEVVEYITAHSTTSQSDEENIMSAAKEYPAYLTLSVTEETEIKQLPTASADSLGAAANTLTATAVYELGGEYWYRVLFSGGVGYIPASAAAVSETRYDDISLHAENWPTEKTYGNAFSVSGIFGTEYNRLFAVNGCIMDMAGRLESSASHTVASGEASYSINASDGATSYSSSLDYNLGFSGLSLGEHKYQLSATAKNYFVEDGKLGFEEKTVTMLDKTFTVVSPAITDGADSEWMQNGASGLTFKTNINNNRFSGVQIDGDTLDTAAYSSDGASPVSVTLKPETLAQLALGEHTITVLGRYGNAEATFSVIEEPACKGEHFGGCATCTKKAVCEACGVEYGELDPTKHINIELRGKTDADIEHNGYTGDLCCLDCGAVIEEGEIIPKPEKPAEPEKPMEPEKKPEPTDKPEEKPEPTDKPQNTDSKREDKGKSAESPKTGDTIQYVFMALLTVSCALTAAILLYRKNETE